MSMSVTKKFYLKIALLSVAYFVAYFGFGQTGEILGGDKAMMALVPGLLIMRFLWSDVWAASEMTPVQIAVARWFFFPFLAVIVFGAYAV